MRDTEKIVEVNGREWSVSYEDQWWKVHPLDNPDEGMNSLLGDDVKAALERGGSSDECWKKAIGQYVDEVEEAEHVWEIQKARYFGYNETTLALIKSTQDDQYFIVRSACYPYGKPSEDKTVAGFKPSHFDDGFHWNDLLDDMDEEFEGDIDAIAKALSALPFIPCQTDDPMEEFEELAELERFLNRKELAEKYDVSNEGNTPHQLGDQRKTTDDLSLYDAFVHTDLKRDEWYQMEYFPYRLSSAEMKPINKHYLSLDDVREVIETICRDFGIACPSHTSITPYNPRSNIKGAYQPETTKMRLMQSEDDCGVPFYVLLHELAHHINNTFVHDGEEESAGHGYRFKKIHMHLMHHYAGIDLETLHRTFQRTYSNGSHGETPLELRDQDITHRDFGEIRTWDALPVSPDTPEDESEDARIPFKDFDPIDQILYL